MHSHPSLNVLTIWEHWSWINHRINYRSSFGTWNLYIRNELLRKLWISKGKNMISSVIWCSLYLSDSDWKDKIDWRLNSIYWKNQITCTGCFRENMVMMIQECFLNAPKVCQGFIKDVCRCLNKISKEKTGKVGNIFFYLFGGAHKCVIQNKNLSRAISFHQPLPPSTPVWVFHPLTIICCYPSRRYLFPTQFVFFAPNIIFSQSACDKNSWFLVLFIMVGISTYPDLKPRYFSHCSYFVAWPEHDPTLPIPKEGVQIISFLLHFSRFVWSLLLSCHAGHFQQDLQLFFNHQ